MATSAWSEFDFGLGDTCDEVRTQVRRLAVEKIAPRAGRCSARKGSWE